MLPWWWLSVVAGVGIMLLVNASLGLAMFSQAQWFTDPGPYPGTWEGYTAKQFVGLAFFTFCAPVAFSLLFTASQQALRAVAPGGGPAHWMVLALSVGSLALLAGLSGAWANKGALLTCAVVGCVDPAKYAPPAVLFPEAGYGWQAIVGFAALFTSVGFGLAQLGAFVRALRHPLQPCDFVARGSVQQHPETVQLQKTSGHDAADADDAPLLQLHPSPVQLQAAGHQLRIGWMAYGLLLPPVLIFGFFTTYIPNSWEYFTPDRIASFAAQKVTHNPNVSTWPDYIPIPEYSWATFKTQEVVLADYFRLKVFPDNLFFYLFLAIVPLVALVTRSVPALHAIVSRGGYFPSPFFYLVRLPFLAVKALVTGKPMPPVVHAEHRVRRSIGELAVLLGIFVLVVLWQWYWLHDHNYNGYWPYPDGFVVFYAEKVARSFGQVAVLLFSLLMFPAARNSVLPYIFGVSWEAAIWMHVVLGRFFLLACFLHMSANYAWYAKTDSFPRDIFAIPMHLSTSIDNFTVPLVSLVTWLSFITMGVCGLWVIRRRFFELFYYAHHITYCLLIPAVLWHAAAGWEFLLPGVAMWFVDRCIRAYRSSTAVAITALEHHDAGRSGGIVTLRIRAPFAYQPGQYLFLNVAEISLFEWHPFTISGSDTNEIELMIKTTGEPSSFTHRLAKRVLVGEALTLSVDGPYGLPVDCHRYAQIFLVCGGIGITPGKAIFEALVANKASLPNLGRVMLLWTARDRKLIDYVASQWEHLTHDDTFHVKLFQTHTGSGGNTVPAGRFPVRAGRPAWSDIHDELELDRSTVAGVAAGHTLVFACGPRAMVEEARHQAHAHGWSFHAETFEL